VISKVTREDEGAYEVSLDTKEGGSKSFNYVLVVMGENRKISVMYGSARTKSIRGFESRLRSDHGKLNT
jgi:hypothetical protein